MQSAAFKTFLLSVLLFSFILPLRPAAAVTLAPGDHAPNFVLEDLEGKSVTLEQFRGKTVLIAFWSTWCSRCEEELVFLRDNFGARNDVVVLLVNQDSERNVSKDRIRLIKDRVGITFPILIDKGLVLWENFGINALPTSVVIGKNGEVRLIEPNFYWGSPENLLAAISRS